LIKSAAQAASNAKPAATATAGRKPAVTVAGPCRLPKAAKTALTIAMPMTAE